jgi:lysine/ornithine N-monooxygenase
MSYGVLFARIALFLGYRQMKLTRQYYEKYQRWANGKMRPSLGWLRQ